MTLLAYCKDCGAVVETDEINVRSRMIGRQSILCDNCLKIWIKCVRQDCVRPRYMSRKLCLLCLEKV